MSDRDDEPSKPKLPPPDRAEEDDEADDDTPEDAASEEEAPPAPPDPLDTLEHETPDDGDSKATDGHDRAPLTAEQLNAILRDPTLAPYLAKIIRDYVKNDADVEEVAQVVLMQLKVGKMVPTDPKALRQYIGGIARNTAMTWFSRKEEGKPETVPIEEERHRHKQEDAGQRRTHASDELEKLGRSVPANQQGTWALFVQHKLLRVSVAKLAHDNGIESSTLHKRFGKLEATLWASGTSLGIITLLLLFFGRFVALQINPPVVTHPYPGDASHEVPPGPVPGSPEAIARAADLRRAAQEQCAARDWKKCLWSYDTAKTLDPQGETPEVKTAHERALEELRKNER
jgi:DNA-directed RNA polymerase specialized sigma24 family protein